MTQAQGVAWITGASMGLGKALALRMAEAGWTVAVSARNESMLQTVGQEGASLGGAIHCYPLDITDSAAVVETVRSIEASLGPIDQAVLNAGSHKPTPAQTLNSDDFANLIALNLMGTVQCLEAVLPSMRQRHSGRIAIVASLAGYRGLPSAAAYGMTKAGLINMAESLRPELERDGIILQVVNPGFVKTPLTDRNDFPMPFLMEADEAARAFYKGLQSDRFEITFPKRFAYIMKFYRALPISWALALSRRMLPKP